MTNQILPQGRIIGTLNPSGKPPPILNGLIADDSDPAIILAGAALLDQHLYNLLAAALLGSKTNIQWLIGRSAQRKTLARSIGLLTDSELSDMRAITNARNRVAHPSLDADTIAVPTFETEEIVSLVGALSNYQAGKATGLNRRAIFVKAVYDLASILNRRLATVKRIKGVSDD